MKSFGTCNTLQRIIILVVLCCIIVLIMEEEEEKVGRQFNSFEELKFWFMSVVPKIYS